MDIGKWSLVLSVRSWFIRRQGQNQPAGIKLLRTPVILIL